MAVIDSIIVFVVNLLIGALGIYVGARVIADYDDYTYAIVTALVGALVWTIVGSTIGQIPFLGAVLTALAYLAIINWRYPGGWINALLITLVAWIAVLVVLYLLAVLGLTPSGAVGVPGV